MQTWFLGGYHGARSMQLTPAAFFILGKATENTTLFFKIINPQACGLTPASLCRRCQVGRAPARLCCRCRVASGIQHTRTGSVPLAWAQDAGVNQGAGQPPLVRDAFEASFV